MLNHCVRDKGDIIPYVYRPCLAGGEFRGLGANKKAEVIIVTLTPPHQKTPWVFPEIGLQKISRAKEEKHLLVRSH